MTTISPVLTETAQTKAPAQGGSTDPAWGKALDRAHGQAASTPTHRHGTAGKAAPLSLRSHRHDVSSAPEAGRAVDQHAVRHESGGQPSGEIIKAATKESQGAPRAAGDAGRRSARQHGTQQAARTSDAGKAAGQKDASTSCDSTKCAVSVHKNQGLRSARNDRTRDIGPAPTHQSTQSKASPPQTPVGTDHVGIGSHGGKDTGRPAKSHAHKAKSTQQAPGLSTPAVVVTIPAGTPHGGDVAAGQGARAETTVSAVRHLPKASKGSSGVVETTGRRAGTRHKGGIASADIRGVRADKSKTGGKPLPLPGSAASPVASVANPVSHTSIQAAQSSTPAQPAPTVPGQVASTVIGLGQESGGSARIRLHPASLGEVTINVHVTHSGVVNVHMAASQASGAQALSTSAPGLMQHLAQAGFTPGTVQTIVQPQPPQGAPSQAGGGPGGAGQNAGGQAGQQQQQAPQDHRDFASQGRDAPARNAETDETVTAYA